MVVAVEYLLVGSLVVAGAVKMTATANQALNETADRHAEIVRDLMPEKPKAVTPPTKTVQMTTIQHSATVAVTP